MANAVKSNHSVMESYKQDKVIFIIDECHRTQFGDMHRLIKQHFENAQYFGFTGTPRFEENKSQDGRATADIFDKCLHHYLIKDAIRDHNVLGFSVEYNQTFNSHDDLDEEYISKLIPQKFGWQMNVLKLFVDIDFKLSQETDNGNYTSMFAVQKYSNGD